MSALTGIVSDISSWPFYSEKFGYDFHGYLVCSPSGTVVVDPVEMPAAVLEQLAGANVSQIVLTNRNHFRDARRLSERTGAPVRVHPADAKFVVEKGVSVDVGAPLLPGDRVGPLHVIACPGKSPG